MNHGYTVCPVFHFIHSVWKHANIQKRDWMRFYKRWAVPLDKVLLKWGNPLLTYVIDSNVQMIHRGQPHIWDVLWAKDQATRKLPWKQKCFKNVSCNFQPELSFQPETFLSILFLLNIVWIILHIHFLHTHMHTKMEKLIALYHREYVYFLKRNRIVFTGKM